MNDKVKVIIRTGSVITLEEWQRMYGLTVGSDKIGRYFSLRENEFLSNIRDYGQLVVEEYLIMLHDAYRHETGEPVIVNACNRDDKKQQQLREKRLRAATHSPHVVSLAWDTDTPGVNELRSTYFLETDEWLWNKAKEINRARSIKMRRLANKLNISVRIGNEQYLKDGNTFIHVDTCPEYYAPGRPYHHEPHPKQWEQPLSW